MKVFFSDEALSEAITIFVPQLILPDIVSRTLIDNELLAVARLIELVNLPYRFERQAYLREKAIIDMAADSKSFS